jgi:hypothetical protein
MFLTKVLDQTKIVFMSLLHLFQFLLGLLERCLSNLLFVLIDLQSLRQFGYLFLKIKVRGLSKSEATLELLGLLRKLLVCLLLVNKPLDSNFPEHRIFQGIVFLKTCQLRRRVRTKKVLEF